MHRWFITRRTISVQDLGTPVAYVPEQVSVQGQYYTEQDGFHKFHDEDGAVVFSIASDSIEMLRRDDAVITTGPNLEAKFAEDLVGALS